MAGPWTRFRALPWWLQLIAWPLAWPLLVPLLIVHRSQTTWAVAAAAVFALVFTPAWVAAWVGDGASDGDARGGLVAPDTDGPSEVAEPPDEISTPTSATEPPSETDTPVEPPASPSPEPTSPSPGGPAAATPAPPQQAPATAVVDVVDGDTLVARDASGQFRIRLAQVDAPETPGECFSAEATGALRALAGPGTVVALRRPGPPYVDDYGRRLGEVLTADGVSVSVELVRQGFAGWGADFADEDPDLAARMRVAEQEAQTVGAGLWSVCGGPHVVAPPPADDSPPPPDGGDTATNPWGTASCHPAYDPCVPPPFETGDLDCADIRAHHPNGVEVDHAHGDPHRLDGDADGRGCE